jgi:hypothetical protein
MRGHIIPHDRMAPRRTDMLTICEQIIPTPTYVGEKSKKNLEKYRNTFYYGGFFLKKSVH